MAAILGAAALGGCGPGREWAPQQSASSRIGIVLPSLTDPYWGAVRDAADGTGAQLGMRVDVASGAGPDDVAGQRAQLRLFAEHGADCVAIAPVDDHSLIPDLAVFNSKKIPLVTVSTGLNAEKVRAAKLLVTASIGVNDIELGHVAGREMVQRIPSGSIAVLRGGPADQSGLDRQKGLIESLMGKLTVSAVREMIDDYQATVDATTELLRQNPGLTGIFAVSDARGLGAAKAVADLGLGKTVTVYSIGGSQASLQAVKDGTIAGTVARYPGVEGTLLARVCAKIRDGDPFPPRITVPVALVTAATAEAALTSYPDPPNPLPDLLP